MSIKEQVITKLNKIKETNNQALIPLGDIDKLASELIDLFSKGEVLILRETLCQCDSCKTKREGWNIEPAPTEQGT
jgi:hypothetical protein